MKLLTLLLVNFTFYNIFFNLLSKSNATKQNLNNLIEDLERINFPYEASISYTSLTVLTSIILTIFLWLIVYKSFVASVSRSLLSNFLKIFFINTSILFGLLYFLRAYNLSRFVLLILIITYPLVASVVLYLIKMNFEFKLGKYLYIFLIPFSILILFMSTSDTPTETINEDTTVDSDSSLIVGYSYESEGRCEIWVGSSNFDNCVTGSSFSILESFNKRISNVVTNNEDVFILTSEGEIFKYILESYQKELLLDIKDKVFYDPAYFESGLFSLAFHPTQEFFLVTYSGLDNSLVVEKYPLQSSDSIPEVLLKIPSSDCCHYSGNLIWSNYFSDFLLSVGDMGNPYAAANTTSNKGKVIFLNKSLETDLTPLINDASNTSPLNNLLGFGLRNPWKTSEYKNYLFIPDVGYQTTEELNVVDLESFNNPVYFGWPYYEGNLKNPNLEYFPIYQWEEDEPIDFGRYATQNSFNPQIFYSHFGSETYRAAIIGGGVIEVKNSKYFESYIFADYLSKEIFSYDFKNNILKQIPLPVDFESSITSLAVHPNHPSKVLITTASGNFIEVELP